MGKKNAGVIFQEDIKKSCQDQNLFFHRIKDMKIPWDLPDWVKKKIIVPKNPYDNFIFSNGYLFPVELKSRKAKSISLDESMIKQHQLDSLEKATQYKGVIPGLILNFRVEGNPTFFIYIEDFLNYKYIAENQIQDHPYQSKVNKSSIPLGICEEIGVKVANTQKRVRYRYYINHMIDEVIVKFGES